MDTRKTYFQKGPKSPGGCGEESFGFIIGPLRYRDKHNSVKRRNKSYLF